ncbi:hypothetical protein ACFFSY_11665 [Paenibacillus aurantiacus]|uniref:Uncharacterized protein n=1 Tax=Paenibacillus aurantiacus TaxID=1936118 RepID=A0ABV5KR61_9BACL
MEFLGIVIVIGFISIISYLRAIHISLQRLLETKQSNQDRS